MISAVTESLLAVQSERASARARACVRACVHSVTTNGERDRSAIDSLECSLARSRERERERERELREIWGEYGLPVVRTRV